MQTHNLYLSPNESATTLTLVFVEVNGSRTRIRLSTITQDLSIWFTVYNISLFRANEVIYCQTIVKMCIQEIGISIRYHVTIYVYQYGNYLGGSVEQVYPTWELLFYLLGIFAPFVTFCYNSWFRVSNASFVGS